MEQKLSKQRPQPGARGLGELDAIVVNIFNSLADDAGERSDVTGPRSLQPARARPRPSSPPGDDNVVHGEAWTSPPPRQPAVDPAAPPLQREPASPRAARTSTDPSPTREAAARGVDPKREVDAQEDQDFLLDEEEEKFVERTVAWLNGRPNPDILLDRIWNRLIDLTEDEEARLASDEYATDGSAGENVEDEAGKPK